MKKLVGTLCPSELFHLFHRAFLLLSVIYLKEPAPPFLKKLQDQEIFLRWPSLKCGEDHQRGIELITGFLSTFTPRELPRLTEDYTRLFSGFERLLAPPYESVYLGKDHILFDGPTLEVRGFYYRHRLTAEEMNRLPDDHLGLELSFLARLCRQEVDAGSRKSAIEEELTGFLDGHLLRWLSPFVQRVLTHGTTGYYRGVALLTRSTVTGFRECLGSRFCRK